MAFDPIAYINEPRWQESRLGLDRIRELLERMGRPQDRLRFVHVAGTNGKGSTCAYLASILQAAGYRTGLFTSPFIEAFEERIRVDGRNISTDELMAATLAVREHAEAMAAETGDHPTEFELMTAVALEHFARRACDIVVLEVGLGGRLDSTNVIDAPEATVIARIGLDHTKLLGNTLAAIAGEKAGIVKDGAPVVSWPQEPEAMAVVDKAARAHGSTLVVPDFSQLEVDPVEWQSCHPEQTAEALDPCHPEQTAETLDSCHPERSEAESKDPARCQRKAVPAVATGDPSAPALRTSARDDEKREPPTPVGDDGLRSATLARPFSYRGRVYRTRLLGSYQPANAALALETVNVLRERGWSISDEAERAGVERAQWPGRFEIVDAGEGCPTVVVDGGHNPQGARALAESLDDVFPGVKPVFIVGVLEDKDYPVMLEAILPHGSGFVAVTPDNPRALPADKLVRAIRWTGQDLLGCSACVNPYVARDMADAVARARELAGPEGVVCAFGSLYSVAALKAAL